MVSWRGVSFLFWGRFAAFETKSERFQTLGDFELKRIISLVHWVRFRSDLCILFLILGEQQGAGTLGTGLPRKLSSIGPSRRVALIHVIM